jgi:cytosine/adenosine deaminase-related metal-dependent hydrolase
MSEKLAEFADGSDAPVRAGDPWDVARELLSGPLSSGQSRVRLALALSGPELSTSFEAAVNDFAVARELGVAMSMHVGVPAGPPPAEAIKKTHDAGLLGDDMQFVHCCNTTAEEFSLIAKAGARVAVSPISEISMGVGFPQTALMRQQGVPPAVSCDSVSTASGDQFDEARTAMLWERGMKMLEITKSAPVEDASQLGMTTRQALETITINAARAMWIDDEVGSLTPGKAADIILLAGDHLNLAPLADLCPTVLGCAHGRNVDTVLVAGQVVKQGGELLLDVDRRKMADDLIAARDRVYGFEYSEGINPPSRAAAALA